MADAPHSRVSYERHIVAGSPDDRATQQAFQRACERGDLEAAKQLRGSQRSARRALYLACASGHLGVASWLCEAFSLDSSDLGAINAAFVFSTADTPMHDFVCRLFEADSAEPQFLDISAQQHYQNALAARALAARATSARTNQPANENRPAIEHVQSDE